MAEEKKGLATLIKQRNSRPSFARMISWEIQNSSNDPVRKSRKSARSTKSTVGSEEGQNENKVADEPEDESVLDSESGDSEYFSAEESCPAEQHSDQCDEEESEGSSGSDVTKDICASFQVASISDRNTERRRRLSKKQKKKKRRQGNEGCVYYAEYKAPFQNADDIHFSISDLSEEVVSRASNMSAIVPSLFELCARSLWSKSNRLPALTYQHLPVPLKNSVTEYRQSQAFASLQLSCLYRSLAELESQEDKCGTQVHARCVWSPVYAVRDTVTGHTDIIDSLGNEGNEISMVIPFTYASFGLPQYDTWRFSGRDACCVMYKTSFMTYLLDMVLPVHFRPPRKKVKDAGHLDEEDQTLVSCSSVILAHLQKRYPDMVKYFGDKTLPYVYWLRGHNKLAMQRFLDLADSSTDTVEKCHYLLQAARLCQLYDQAESARRLFRRSQDLLADSPLARRRNTDKQQLRKQFLMLCANTYDQGVMCQDKALQSLEAWRHLTTLPSVNASSYIVAAEAVLCFHLSNMPGETIQQKIAHVMDHVTTCSHHSWAVTLHMSLLHAWLGNRSDSVNAYRRLTVTDNTPGQEFKSDDVSDQIFTPWHTLVDAVSVYKRAVRPLPVVWRTQLGFLRVITGLEVFDADLQGRTAGLRLSPEGHLTGDMQLVLPPVHSINLDLYTGQLIMPTSAGASRVQKTTFNSRYTKWDDDEEHFEYEYANGSYALTSTELYNYEGTQVHLLTTGAGQLLKVDTPVAHLQLTNATGQRTKFSLKHALKAAVREMVERDIKSCFGNANNPNFTQAHKGLKYASAHNLSVLSANDAKYVGEMLVYMETKKKEKAKGGKGKSKYYPRYYRPTDPRNRLSSYTKFHFTVKDFVSYGHTVCLCGQLIPGNTYNLGYFLFLDVSSRQAFTSPVTHFHKSQYWNDGELAVIGRHGHRVPRADVMCLQVTSSAADMPRFFGQAGKEFLNKSDTRLADCQCVLGSSIFCIENQRHGRAGGQQGLDLTPMLTERRFHQQVDQHENAVDVEVLIDSLDPEMQMLKTVADRLLLIRDGGLQVLDPTTVLPEPLLCSPKSECHLALSEDSTTLLVHPKRVSVLDEKKITSPSGSPMVLVPVAVNDYLLMLGILERCSADEPIVEIAFCIQIPGHATEVCLVGQTAGYLISTTLHSMQARMYYRETVCHLSASGQLLAILPCLGPGPRSFCPVLLPPAPDQEGDREGAGSGLPTWYVYMRDGHEGIIAVRL